MRRTTGAVFGPDGRPIPFDAIGRVLEVIPDPTLVVDSGGRIVASNSGLPRMFGYLPFELEKLSIDDLVAQPGRQRHAAHRATFAGSPQRCRMGTGIEVRGVRKDGTEFPLEVSLNPIPTETGLLVCATLRDASERAHTERVAADRQRDLDEMKNGFLRAVSHELRAPLSAMLVISETLASWSRQLTQERIAELASTIHANTRRLDRLLADLIDNDRLSRGIIEAQRRETDVYSLARRVIDNLDLSGHHVQVVEGGPVVAGVDPGQIERILENLVMNSVRHTPDGTPIWVTIEQDSDGTTLTVEDAGPGVADAQKSEIFEAFHGGDAADRAPGTGVGLSLVKRFAALHGGRAWVEDRDGGGAAFHVLLRDAPDPQDDTR